MTKARATAGKVVNLHTQAPQSEVSAKAERETALLARRLSEVGRATDAVEALLAVHGDVVDGGEVDALSFADTSGSMISACFRRLERLREDVEAKREALSDEHPAQERIDEIDERIDRDVASTLDALAHRRLTVVPVEFDAKTLARAPLGGPSLRSLDGEPASSMERAIDQAVRQVSGDSGEVPIRMRRAAEVQLSLVAEGRKDRMLFRDRDTDFTVEMLFEVDEEGATVHVQCDRSEPASTVRMVGEPDMADVATVLATHVGADFGSSAADFRQSASLLAMETAGTA